eukprot:3607311-Pyramimonas_sp.AAC.1
MAADLWVRPASAEPRQVRDRGRGPPSPLAHWDATAEIGAAMPGSSPNATRPSAASSIQKQK